MALNVNISLGVVVILEIRVHLSERAHSLTRHQIDDVPIFQHPCRIRSSLPPNRVRVRVRVRVRAGIVIEVAFYG